MWATLVLFVPVAAVLGLVAFGQHGPLLEPTWPNVGLVAGLAMILGPVAVGVLGLLVWLLAVVVLVCLGTMAGVLRQTRQAAAR